MQNTPPLRGELVEPPATLPCTGLPLPNAAFVTSAQGPLGPFGGTQPEVSLGAAPHRDLSRPPLIRPNELDGGAGVTIYTLTDTDVGVSDYFEFTLASVNASTAFPTGNLNIRWFDGATETVATLTLAGGDTDGVNLDGATFRLQWQTAPATGDTVRVVYHESISAGDAVTVDRESISFTVP